MKPATRIILLALLVFIGVYSMGAPESWAFNFTVTPDTDDAVDANPGDTFCASQDGNCTLRAAIQEANSFPEQHNITLPAGTYILSLGELPIAKDITINGAGQGITIIDGNNFSRVFNSQVGGKLTLNNLTVKNGTDSEGGGIYVQGELILQNVTLTNNSAASGLASSGGGILNGGILTIKNSAIGNNQAGNGSGIFNGGFATIVDTTVASNIAGSGSGVGGGIYNIGTLFLEKTTINGSIADTGGGLFNAGIMDLTNVTLSGNSANSSGGGIYNGIGGGAPRATLTNVTISNNTAPIGGGSGIFNHTGNIINLKNTIVANSAGGNCAGTITSNGHNLENGTSCNLSIPLGDLINVDPLLGPLQDNGGPTFTQSLGKNSAKNVGAGCPDRDQRGYPRLLNACDLGAYEDTTDHPFPAITTLAPNTSPIGGLGFTLTVNGYTYGSFGFEGSSVVHWNGNAKPTTFVNTSQLSISITAADLALAGTAKVTVFNPAPGGGLSNEVIFTITRDNPTPTITSLIPDSRPAGGSPFTLTVNGSNFLDNSLSVVLWNGFARPTAFVNASQLTANIPASDLAAMGTASVTISNSPPGGGISAPPATFTIGPPSLYLPLIIRN
jgi:CSLREA domain-containing protein